MRLLDTLARQDLIERRADPADGSIAPSHPIGYASLGTAIGAALAWLMLAQTPSVWSLIALVPERILDTLAGASIGIILAVVCSTLEDRTLFARYLDGRKAR